MRRTALRVGLSVAAIAAMTVLVAALRPIAPDVSLGALYTVVVLAAAILWGTAYALGVSVASLLAFDFFILAPRYTLSLKHGEDWTALVVYLVTGVVVSQLAATSRRRAAAALEAESLRRSDAVKTAVIRSVSHDLRTPLATIATALDGLDLALGEREQRELLDTVRLERARLERLVENLLDLSRLQAGAAVPAPQLWAADELAAQALDELSGSERVVVEIPDGLPPVRADAAQVQRALVNLLENALRFSPPRSPVVVRVGAEDGTVVFRVTDAGPGIAPDDLARIFEAFHRSAGSRGVGLGLAIARGFAEANGGRIWAEPAQRGASLALALPAEELPA